jgi:hypothetical protein
MRLRAFRGGDMTALKEGLEVAEDFSLDSLRVSKNGAIGGLDGLEAGSFTMFALLSQQINAGLLPRDQGYMASNGDTSSQLLVKLLQLGLAGGNSKPVVFH